MRRFACSAVALALLGACEGSPRLVVQVRTDLAPELELARVVVTLRDDAGGAALELTTDADRGEDWGAGVRVFEEPVAAGRRRLEIAALDAGGAVLVARPLSVEVRGAAITVATVLLSRDCRARSCADGEACVGGRCASEACTEESGPAGCTPVECASAADCAPIAACATAECTASGTCFAAPRHEECAADAYCDAALGCVGPPREHVACTDDTECAVGEICAFEHALRCARPCTADAECGPGQRCARVVGQTRTHCVGDPCDPVADTGCAPDQTCSALTLVLNPTGAPMDFAVAPACRIRGPAPDGGACDLTRDCGAGLCRIEASLDAGACARHCTSSADCAETCVRHVRFASDDLGLCSAGCDPIGGAGCGPGLECVIRNELRVDDPPPGAGGTTRYVTWCAPLASRTLGEPCDINASCGLGTFCIAFAPADAACAQLCVVGAASCDCRPTDLTTVGGQRIGICNPP